MKRAETEVQEISGARNIYAAGEPLANTFLTLDTRTFPEILTEWQKFEECDGQKFLDKTGLAFFITEDDLRTLEIGEKIPSERLTRVMALFLPNGILRNEGACPSLPHFYGFLGRTKPWCKLNRTKSILDISSHVFADFSNNTLAKIRYSAPANDPLRAPTIEPPAGPQMRAHILGCLGKIGNSDKSLEEIEELLAQRYKAKPKETVQALQGLLDTSDMHYTRNELISYLDTVVSPVFTPLSKALCFLRQSRGLTQEQMAASLKVHNTTVSAWECGKKPLPQKRLGSLVKLFNLSDKEAESFILLAVPDIIKYTGDVWLREKIKAKEWEHIHFPALDPAWLAKQPHEKQIGLLLGTYRRRAALLQKALSAELNVETTSINNWELGLRPIPADKLGAFVRILSLTDAEAERFILLVKSDITKNVGIAWLQEKIKTKEWEYINFPALDPIWLAKQPEEKQAGVLLSAYLMRRNMTEIELGKMIRVAHVLINRWKNAKRPIPLARIDALAEALAISPAEKQHFVATVEISRTASMHSAPEDAYSAWGDRLVTQEGFEHPAKGL